MFRWGRWVSSKGQQELWRWLSDSWTLVQARAATQPDKKWKEMRVIRNNHTRDLSAQVRLRRSKGIGQARHCKKLLRGKRTPSHRKLNLQDPHHPSVCHDDPSCVWPMFCLEWPAKEWRVRDLLRETTERLEQEAHAYFKPLPDVNWDHWKCIIFLPQSTVHTVIQAGMSLLNTSLLSPSERQIHQRMDPVVLWRYNWQLYMDYCFPQIQ